MWTWWVGGTRVSLETMIINYKQGSSPEEIVENFDMLELDPVYQIIGYYLANREAVELLPFHNQCQLVKQLKNYQFSLVRIMRMILSTECIGCRCEWYFFLYHASRRSQTGITRGDLIHRAPRLIMGEYAVCPYHIAL